MTMTIGMLAQESGVTIDTIRYYERQGLIVPDDRTQAGYRQYSQFAVRRVKFIRTAASLGFTLKEIDRLLNFDGSNEATTADVHTMIQAKINSHTREMHELWKLKKTLEHISDLCPGDETPASECPILDFFYPAETNTSPQ